MPEYRGAVGPRGPVLTVGLSAGADLAKRGFGGPPATYAALIDTGANITAVSPGVQAQLRAMILDSQPIERPNAAPIIVDLVDVRLKLGDHRSKHRWFNVEAVVVQPATAGVDVLIGRDLLREFLFTWNGPAERFRLRYDR